MHRGEPKIGHVDVKKTSKMAELVEDEGPVEITIPEARLDDPGRRKLIQFYEKKPVRRRVHLQELTLLLTDDIPLFPPSV